MPSQRFKGVKVFKGLKRLEGFKGTLEGEEGALKDKTFRQNLPEENVLAQSM